MAADTKIVLTAEDRTLAAFNSAKRNLDGLSGGLSKVSGLLSTFGIGAGLSGAGIAAFVKSSIDAADEMGKLSQRVGVGTEALSALSYAASLSDVSTESLANGLKKLAVNAADTAKGTGEARDAFAALGINVKDSTGNLKGADVLMGEVAGQFAQFEDGAAKTALAVKLFGKAGADLIPMLNAGAQGLADMRAEAERLGIIISPEQAKAAEAFNDDLTRMAARAKGVGLSLSGPLLDGMNAVLERWSRAAQLSGNGYNFFDLLFGVGINPVGNTVDQLDQVNEKIAYTQKKLESVRAGGGDFFGMFKPEELQMELENLKHLKSVLEGLDMESIGGNQYKGNTGFIREQQAAIEELSKLKPPDILDPEKADKTQAALAKAFDTKPIDDFLATFQQKSRAIDAEYRKLVSDLTGPSIEGAKGFDIGAEISKGRSALAGGDSVGVETAVERAKTMLKGLKDNGGITDEITYYARQLQQFEQDNLKAQQSVAQAALATVDKVALDVNQTAEKLKFQVDAGYLAEQMKAAMQQAMADLKNNPLQVPVVAAPSVGVTSPGAQSVAILATKLGGR